MIATEAYSLCECGCGEACRNRFVHGHNRRGKYEGGCPEGVLVDPEDEWLLIEYTWHINDAGYLCRTLHPSGNKERLHIRIMGMREGLEIDHVNGNKLDCRRANLEHKTHAENLGNVHAMRKHNTSGALNVVKRGSRFTVRVVRDKHVYHGGTFDTLEEAEAEAVTFRAKVYEQ